MRRRVAWFGLIALVLVAHALFGVCVLSSVIGWNTAAEPRRIEMTLTRPLLPSAAPAAAAAPVPVPVPAPATRPAHAVRSTRASSAPLPASAPQEAGAVAADDGESPDSRALLVRQALALADRLDDERRAIEAAASASAASAAQAGAAGASAAAAAAAPATAIAGPPRPPFEWPPSTRLTYTLTGERGGGKLYGRATVEWRHEGSRYQVRFDIHITPLIDQHMSSSGEITADGLAPSHYDEAFSFLFYEPRVRRIEFGDNEVRLNNGSRVARLAQTQDGASQFVQFVWMFSTHPEWLAPGNVVQIPLALPNNLRRWNYQVVGAERLELAFGGLDAVHLKPLLDGPRRPNEYPFEIWTAPTLQYLPVQILVKVDEHTWAVLSLDDLPMQAAAGVHPSPPRPPAPFPPPPALGER